MTAIDRDALVTLLLATLKGTTVPAVPLADRILALAQPVDGITLRRPTTTSRGRVHSSNGSPWCSRSTKSSCCTSAR